MSKQVAIEIEIKGTQEALELQKRLREIRKELKETEDQDAYDNLTKELIQVQALLKNARAEQRLAVESFRATDEATSAYQKLSSQLNVSRKRLKDLAAEGKEASQEFEDLQSEVLRLDKRLKDIDASAGQFQRNVGDYENAIKKAITTNSTFFNQINEGFSNVSSQVGFAAKSIVAAFAAFQIGQVIGQAIGSLQDFVKQLDEVQRQVAVTFDVTGAELENLTAQVKASADVFETDFNDTLRASNILVQQFGVEAEESINLVNNALAASADQAKTLGLIESELSKLTGLGLDADSALSLLVEASNRGFNVDVISEPLVAIREQTNATVKALEDAFGKERTEEIFATFQTAPLQAIQQISDGFAKLEPTSKEAGAVLADVFKSAGEDNVQLVRSLGALNLELDSLTEKAGESAQRQLELVAAQEELNRAQIDVANSLKPVTDELTIFATRATTLFLRLTQGLLSFLGAIKDVGVAVGSFVASLPGVSQALGLVRSAFNLAAQSVERFRQQTTAADESISNVAVRLRQRANEIKKSQEAEAKQAQAAANDRLKNESNAAKKRREQAQKDRAQFLQDEQKFIATRSALLQRLDNRLTQLQLQNIIDSRTQAIAIERQSFLDRQKAREEELNAFISSQEEQAEKIKQNFGRNSKELTEFEAQRQASLNDVRSRFNEIREQDALQTDEKIRQINLQFDSQGVRDLEASLQERLQATEKGFELELLKIQELEAQKILTQEESAAQQLDIQKELLTTQLAELSKQEKELQVLRDLGLGGTKEQFDAIALLRKKLNIELARLEKEQTANTELEATKRIRTRKEEFEEILGGVQQGISVVQQFISNIDAVNERRFEEREQAQAERIENLNEELQNATGLEREFLENRLAQEQEFAQKIARDRVSAERQAAIQEKAIAISQSIINTALAVTKALPNPFAAASAGALGLAQTAIIAAQPLATGGIVGKNIDGKPIRRANGDNRLTTLKTGEVVLNQNQQRRLGGAKTFKAIGVPGFANGGLVTPPISAPVVANAQTDLETGGQLVLETRNLAVANSQRIDRLNVVFTTDTLTQVEDDQTDRKNINDVATL